MDIVIDACFFRDIDQSFVREIRCFHVGQLRSMIGSKENMVGGGCGCDLDDVVSGTFNRHRRMVRRVAVAGVLQSRTVLRIRFMRVSTTVWQVRTKSKEQEWYHSRKPYIALPTIKRRVCT